MQIRNKSLLYWTNYLVLQWFFIRLAKIVEIEPQPSTNEAPKIIGWELKGFIVPMTGWTTDFVKFWPWYVGFGIDD